MREFQLDQVWAPLVFDLLLRPRHETLHHSFPSFNLVSSHPLIAFHPSSSPSSTSLRQSSFFFFFAAGFFFVHSLLCSLTASLYVKFCLFFFLLERKSEAYKVPTPKAEWVAEWVSQNDEAVRQMPIWVGGISLLAVLVNRAISGIAPVSNASRFLSFRFYFILFCMDNLLVNLLHGHLCL